MNETEQLNLVRAKFSSSKVGEQLRKANQLLKEDLRQMSAKDAKIYSHQFNRSRSDFMKRHPILKEFIQDALGDKRKDKITIHIGHSRPPPRPETAKRSHAKGGKGKTRKGKKNNTRKKRH